MNRRGMLKAGGLLAAASAGMPVSALWPCPASASAEAGGRIALENLHTGERLDVEYRRDAEYLHDALAAIEVLLRDFRNGEQHAVDPKLMDYLVEVARSLGVKPKFSVISGYRSPETNERLHELSGGVSQHSLHMQGRAIDVRMAGIDCADLAARAQELKLGGVGFYRASNFVHLDTGTFRTWRG